MFQCSKNIKMCLVCVFDLKIKSWHLWPKQTFFKKKNVVGTVWVRLRSWLQVQMDSARGREETIHLLMSDQVGHTMFKIITQLPLNTSVFYLKTGWRWFQNHHFEYWFFNNVFQTTHEQEWHTKCVFLCFCFWTLVFSV